MKLLKINALLCLLALPLASCQPDAGQLRSETRMAHGNRYTVFHPGQLTMQVVTSRPEPADDHYQLSIAAAYTDENTNQPLDLLVCAGKVLQPTAKVGFLDGVLTIVDDTLTISRLTNGPTPPGAAVERVGRWGGTLLLQELLVFQGKNLRPEGGSVFQRRALVEFSGRRFAMVESGADSLTMHQFAADLLALGAVNALYLDMGDWDEGWYKRGGEVVALGHRRTQTDRQSNWLVFSRPL